ncbi:MULTISPECIES: hypothetical protein [unclassified Nonomuraea]|uniref:hypothetical protein n=1 Tax=unclassified Nonomuraea TaxID=2593643 RepID=UPI00340B20AF
MSIHVAILPPNIPAGMGKSNHNFITHERVRQWQRKAERGGAFMSKEEFSDMPIMSAPSRPEPRNIDTAIWWHGPEHAAVVVDAADVLLGVPRRAGHV